MGQSRFRNRLFQFRLIVFEVCETVLFVTLILALTAYSLKHIVQFGWPF